LLLYYKSTSFREQSGALNWILGFIRFLTITFMSILLLSPLLKSLITEVKKPVIVLAQDQSESILADMKAEEQQQYQDQFRQLGDALGEDYELKQYAFGQEVREGIDFQYEDKVSNLSSFLQSMYDLYSNQNLGAIVMATDGIYNEGSNPIYAGTKLAAPIYTVALGDTTAKKDLVLKRVFHNKIAYLGDKFSIQIDVAAQNCSGNNTQLNISSYNNGQTESLQKIPIKINKNDFFTTKEIILDAKRSGVQRYVISLSRINGEVTTLNNSKEIFVDILDARQKILILSNTPHPDVSAIKQSISTNKNYEVNTATIDKANLNVATYDFVILHQLPSPNNSADAVLKVMNDRKIPRLFITGMQTDFRRFNRLQSLISIQVNTEQTNDVQASVANNFSLFNIDEIVNQELPKFAPLLAPFGEFDDNANTQVLLYQRIGKVDTQYPLLLFGEENNIKTGVLTAEGIWKWRLFDYLQHQNHNVFDELLSKSIQYLSLKEDKRRFRVSMSKNIFNENESIYFDAELYNDSYQLINEPEANMTITNSKGKDFNFTFNKTGKSYALDAGFFPVDNYTFRASVMSSGQQLTYSGQFSIRPVQLEVYETTADHALLRLLSEKYGGQIVYPGQLTSIADMIKSKETVKPTIYQTSKTRSVINLKWIFFILMVLLTLEWFLRRFYGSY
ncbi:MAG: hypothetical protein AAF985_04355, partial [Bacteroidota bacterium]